MYTVESLDKYTDASEFIYLTNEEDIEKLKEECDKLTYLKTYPTMVRARIREKLAQIRLAENELSLCIKTCSSNLAKIKKKQELRPSYSYIGNLKDELRSLRKELEHAENVKLVANTRLDIYQKFLDEYNARREETH